MLLKTGEALLQSAPWTKCTLATRQTTVVTLLGHNHSASEDTSGEAVYRHFIRLGSHQMVTPRSMPTRIVLLYCSTGACASG